MEGNFQQQAHRLNFHYWREVIDVILVHLVLAINIIAIECREGHICIILAGKKRADKYFL